MSTELAPSLRIGEVAARVGVTTRTIRYYEEFGLLGNVAARTKGGRRCYGEADVARLEGLIRLRDLLGLSLDELRDLAEAEETRAELREEWEDDPSEADRIRIVDRAIAVAEQQLVLVRARQQRLDDFADELDERLRTLGVRRAELTRGTASGRV